ncbi:hypothetical protein WA026_019330 [Henosepilachna vigintioctopunctata]|uniref:Uncharacterized protein n=1 Tax=Henosepilachna vigintioctopunctata TaxID=420089 RepID=A0AAW1U595_9CUCU
MSSTTVAPTTTSSTIVSKGEPQLEKVILESNNIKSINVVANAPPNQELTKTSASEIQEKAEPSNDVNYKRERLKEPELALKYEICVPYTRFPLTLKKLRKVNTFIPISINYFKVIHYMDTLMVSNVYFTRLGLPWHPLLSRLYFSVLCSDPTSDEIRKTWFNKNQIIHRTITEGLFSRISACSRPPLTYTQICLLFYIR